MEPAHADDEGEVHHQEEEEEDGDGGEREAVVVDERHELRAVGGHAIALKRRGQVIGRDACPAAEALVKCGGRRREDRVAAAAEHAERPFFAALVAFVSGGQVLKMELSGDDAIAKWRALIGPTDSNKAREEAPDSVRAKFGTDNQRNAAHGSDSTESAARELAMMFA